MNERPAADRLRQAMRNASLDDLEEAVEAADELGRQAVAVALAEPERPPPQPERYKPSEEEDRQRMTDEALRDASRAMEQHRDRLGRRITSTHDAKVMRQMWELLRSMAAGSDNDPGFPS